MCGPKACCSGAREGCTGAKQGCIGARDSRDHLSSWSKHLLHSLLTTLDNFEASDPCSRHSGSQPSASFQAIFCILPCPASITLPGKNRLTNVHFMLVLKVLGGSFKTTCQKWLRRTKPSEVGFAIFRDGVWSLVREPHFLLDFQAGKGSRTLFPCPSPKVRKPHLLSVGLPEPLPNLQKE